jgi:hypothetical protein
MKKPKITISKTQLSYCQELLKNECLAVTVKLFFEYVFKKSIQDTKYAYCSSEYNTINLVVSRIANDKLHLLNIVE